MIDKATNDRINKVHPKLRDELREIVNYIETLGIRIRITQGLRTIEEQNALYAQGRTKPGKIVTNAKGGTSFHNYGLAVDFCLLHKDGSVSFSINEDTDGDHIKDWDEVVNAFKKYGWEHGDRGYFDNPHFQKVYGLTPSKCLQKIALNQVDAQGYILLP